MTKILLLTILCTVFQLSWKQCK